MIRHTYGDCERGRVIRLDGYEIGRDNLHDVIVDREDKMCSCWCIDDPYKISSSGHESPVEVRASADTVGVWRITSVVTWMILAKNMLLRIVGLGLCIRLARAGGSVNGSSISRSQSVRTLDRLPKAFKRRSPATIHNPEPTGMLLTLSV